MDGSMKKKWWVVLERGLTILMVWCVEGEI
jgi:hypothetical protein